MLIQRILAVAVCCLSVAVPSVQAAYPERPVTIIVPFAAGSATDNIIRAMSHRLRDKLNVSVVVENRAGANGLIGTSRGAKSEADGYTLTAVTGTTIAQNPWLLRELTYDPLRDFEAIGALGGFALAIVVKADSPMNSYEDLLATIRKDGEKISYATSYGMQTVCGEVVRQEAGAGLTRVTYKSSPQSIVDLIGGTVTFICADLATSLGSIKSASIKALAVLMPDGSRYIPDVRPMQKTHPGFPQMQSWVGLAAPAGTPKAVLQKLSDAVHAIARDPAYAATLSAVGFEPTPMDAATFAGFMRDEHARWQQLIQKAGISPQ